jgi:hypothetical protein
MLGPELAGRGTAAGRLPRCRGLRVLFHGGLVGALGVAEDPLQPEDEIVLVVHGEGIQGLGGEGLEGGHGDRLRPGLGVALLDLERFPGNLLIALEKGPDAVEKGALGVVVALGEGPGDLVLPDDATGIGRQPVPETLQALQPDSLPVPALLEVS